MHVAEEVSVYTDLLSVGSTSMKFKIEAWCRSRDGDQQVKVTEAVFASVAIDSGFRHVHPADSLRSARGDSRYVTFGLDRTAPFT